MEESDKKSAIVEPKRTGSALSNRSKQQEVETPVPAVSSRQSSANKTAQQRAGSRPSTAKRSQHDDQSSDSSPERSKLIKLGEQMQIPTDDVENQRTNSPPPSTSLTALLALNNPLLEKKTPKADAKNSRPGSQTSRKSSTTGSVNQEKRKESDVVSNKSRTSSRASKQPGKVSDEKVISPRSGRESQTSKHDPKDLKDSRRSSTDAEVPTRLSAKPKQERISSSAKPKSPSPKRSAQTSRKNSSNVADRNGSSPVRIPSTKSPKVNPSNVHLSLHFASFQRSSLTDSDNERKVPKLTRLHSSSEASTPRNDQQSKTWIKKVPIPPLQTTNDDIRASRPQSPNVEQIAERNQHSSSSKKATSNEYH